MYIYLAGNAQFGLGWGGETFGGMTTKNCGASKMARRGEEEEAKHSFIFASNKPGTFGS
jgi:hypothetical protein